ncbi:hypothetical protein NPIL_595771, partial [Nephila pilipes]
MFPAVPNLIIPHGNNTKAVPALHFTTGR